MYATTDGTASERCQWPSSVSINTACAANILSLGSVLQLSASSHVWFATKQSADALQAYVKTKPLWLRDPRTNQELALSVKKARRPGASAGGAPTRPTITPNAVISSGSNNSSSSLLPLLHFNGISGDMSGQLAQLQASQRLAAAQGMDISMLNPDVIRLLPMQQQQAQQLAAGGLSAALPQLPTGYMTVDVCEAMLDSMYDNSSMGLSMPVHLQPAMAAQVNTPVQHRYSSACHASCGLAPVNSACFTAGTQLCA